MQMLQSRDNLSPSLRFYLKNNKNSSTKNTVCGESIRTQISIFSYFLFAESCCLCV